MRLPFVAALPFVLGLVLGWSIEPSLTSWLGAALGMKLISLAPHSAIFTRLEFGLCTGFLFALSVLAAYWACRSDRRLSVIWAATLASTGIAASALVAVYHHWTISGFAPMLQDMSPTSVSYASIELLPVLSIPISGAIIVLLISAIRRFYSTRTMEQNPS